MKTSIENLLRLQREYEILYEISDVLDKLETQCVDEDVDEETLRIINDMQKLVNENLTSAHIVANRMAKELRLHRPSKN